MIGEDGVGFTRALSRSITIISITTLPLLASLSALRQPDARGTGVVQHTYGDSVCAKREQLVVWTAWLMYETVIR